MKPGADTSTHAYAYKYTHTHDGRGMYVGMYVCTYVRMHTLHNYFTLCFLRSFHECAGAFVPPPARSATITRRGLHDIFREQRDVVCVGTARRAARNPELRELRVTPIRAVYDPKRAKRMRPSAGQICTRNLSPTDVFFFYSGSRVVIDLKAKTFLHTNYA